MAAKSPPLTLEEIRAMLADPAEPVSAQQLARLQRDPRAGVQKLCRTLAGRQEAQRKERARLDRMLQHEQRLWYAGIERVAGVDEVGIGPLAGPVVAAAVVLARDSRIAGIDDSKVLSEAARMRLDLDIRAGAAVGIGVVEVDEVDRLNVYHAGLRAMQRAVGNLPVAPQHVLVDARTIPDIRMPQDAYVKGDTLSLSIAAASIVAKVYRDRVMTELGAQYPGYGFAIHKGYPTAAHQDAVRRLGPCPIHRRSFDFIRELCGEYSAAFYELKQRALAVATRNDLLRWEAAVASAGAQLSQTESRKLQLMKNRLRKKIGA